MRTFAQKPNQPQKQGSSNFAWLNTTTHGKNHHSSPLVQSQPTIGDPAVLTMLQNPEDSLKVRFPGAASPRSGHDFSWIPIHSAATEAIETKLAFNQTADIYEEEAERVSDQVLNMSAPQLQRPCASGGQCPNGQKQQSQAQGRLQTKHIGSSDLGQTTAPPLVHEVLRSPGQPLDPATRLFMEPRFGHDFSKLRLHTDAQAAESAQAIGAAAYTAGGDIVFAAGQFNPYSRDGRQLIAHELTHVLQQGNGSRRVQQQPAKKGRVVRVERESRFRRKPPGPGAYTQAELNEWYDRHPKLTNAGGANLDGGERTKDREFTPEELWKKGYFYAKTTVSEDTQQAWESWLNDEGDGKVLTIFVRFDK